MSLGSRLSPKDPSQERRQGDNHPTRTRCWPRRASCQPAAWSLPMHISTRRLTQHQPRPPPSSRLRLHSPPQPPLWRLGDLRPISRAMRGRERRPRVGRGLPRPRSRPRCRAQDSRGPRGASGPYPQHQPPHRGHPRPRRSPRAMLCRPLLRQCAAGGSPWCRISSRTAWWGEKPGPRTRRWDPFPCPSCCNPTLS